MSQIMSAFTYGAASEIEAGVPADGSAKFVELLKKFCQQIADGTIERYAYRSDFIHRLANNIADGDAGKLQAILCRNVTSIEQFSDLSADDRGNLRVFLEHFRKAAWKEEDLSRFLFPADLLKG